MQPLLKCQFWGGLALVSLAVIAYLLDVPRQVGFTMYDASSKKGLNYGDPAVVISFTNLTTT